MIFTLTSSVPSFTSIVLVAAVFRAIYKFSSSFILRQYLSRSIDASPALLFHPSPTPPSSAISTPQSSFVTFISTRLPPYITIPRFSITALLASRRAAEDGRLEELWMRWLRESGTRTVEVRMLGCRIVLTDEGANVEEVLGGDTGEWENGGRGWFGRKVLELGEENELVDAQREAEDLSIGASLEALADGAVQKNLGNDGDVALKDLSEKLATEIARNRLWVQNFGSEEKNRVRHTSLDLTSDHQKSAGKDISRKDDFPYRSIAHLLQYTLLLLAEHSSIRSQLEAELSTSSSSSIEPQQIPYLTAILRETRRLYPFNRLHLRQAQKDTYLPHSSDPDHPLLVPKDAYVACLVGSLNRRTELFGLDAEIFRPKRWIDESSRSGRVFGLEEEGLEFKLAAQTIAELVKMCEIGVAGTEQTVRFKRKES